MTRKSSCRQLDWHDKARFGFMSGLSDISLWERNGNCSMSMHQITCMSKKRRITSRRNVHSHRVNTASVRLCCWQHKPQQQYTAICWQLQNIWQVNYRYH